MDSNPTYYNPLLQGDSGALKRALYKALDFPCFSRGSYSQDQAPRGRVTDYRVPVELHGVHIDPGDLLFGDLDGVVVIPARMEREVIERAWVKATGEKTTGDAIRSGMSASEAFERYGIM